MQTLILDQGYQPQRIVPWQRAVCLLFVGKAEVVEDYGEHVNSVSFSMPMPAVVRMTRTPKRYRRDVRFSRLHVLLRDAFRCQYCGETKRGDELTYDHVMPRSRGGPTSWENIASACRPCNLAKGNRTPAEARMPLLKRPMKPTWLPPLKSVAHGAVPESWRMFLPSTEA
jgi:5-methylcytosine-specific restriction endonuclease McrA